MNIAFSDHLRHHQDVRANSNSGITCFSEKSRSTSGSRATGSLTPRRGSQIAGDLGGSQGISEGIKEGYPRGSRGDRNPKSFRLGDPKKHIGVETHYAASLPLTQLNRRLGAELIESFS